MRDIKNYAENYIKDAGESFEDIMVKYRRKKVLKLLDKYAHRKILEIGCGLEPLFKFLDSNFYDEYTVIEPSKDFYKNAVNLAKNNHKIICRNEFFSANNDLKNKEFDFIIISGLLHEVERPNEFLAEVKKICRQNTIVHINVPNANSFHRLLAKAMGLIKDTTDFSARNVIYQQHNVFDLNSLENLVKSSGFDVMEKGSYFIKPFTHKQMYAMIKENIIDESVLDGLYTLNDTLPFGGGVSVRRFTRT